MRLQEPTGLAALGWFDEPLLAIPDQPQVLDDEELEAVLDEPVGRKITRLGKIYGTAVSVTDTRSARKILSQALAEAKDRVTAKGQQIPEKLSMQGEAE